MYSQTGRQQSEAKNSPLIWRQFEVRVESGHVTVNLDGKTLPFATSASGNFGRSGSGSKTIHGVLRAEVATEA